MCKIFRIQNDIKKIKNILKDKNGISTIEFVICLMIFIMLFSFIFDLYFISYKQFTVSLEGSRIMRIISNQSGVEKNTPTNFPGGDDNYMTVDELYDKLNKRFKDIGIGENDWDAQIIMKDKVDSTKERIFELQKGKEGIKSDYRDYITFIIHFKYKWGLWSQFAEEDLYGNITVERHGFSEWKEDYNTWEGESEGWI